MNFLNGFAAGMGESAYMARLQAQQLEMQMAKMKMGLQAAMLGECIPAPKRVATTKCHGCGSHEWRQHNNVRICAYCRSGQ